METIRILFLCTGNSCRSQMAEGWVKFLHAGKIEALSAGTQPSRVNPLAIQVMAEAGVDISTHRSKHWRELLGQRFDYVVTLCGDARDNCPVFPGASRMVHVGFPDPARAVGTPREVLNEFRRVRDMIRDFVAGLPGTLANADQIHGGRLVSTTSHVGSV
ncbi:MAG TPA: arsenate reductase ArsC [Firmicutes bacterium]|nr:arsenate reductase ArsC [Bacillota bacterium]